MPPHLCCSTLVLLLAGLPAQEPPPYAGDRCDHDGVITATDGSVLTQVDPAAEQPAAATPCPRSHGAAVATGLAVAPGLGQLWILDSHGVITACQQAAPPVPLAVMATGLVGTKTAGPSALALDEGQRLLFFTWADFATGTTELFTAPMNAAGDWFDRRTLALPANLGPITGLAVDAVRCELRLGDGRRSVVVRYVVDMVARQIRFSAPVALPAPAGPQSTQRPENQVPPPANQALKAS